MKRLATQMIMPHTTFSEMDGDSGCFQDGFFAAWRYTICFRAISRLPSNASRPLFFTITCAALPLFRFFAVFDHARYLRHVIRDPYEEFFFLPPQHTARSLENASANDARWRTTLPMPVLRSWFYAR